MRTHHILLPVLVTSLTAVGIFLYTPIAHAQDATASSAAAGSNLTYYDITGGKKNWVCTGGVTSQQCHNTTTTVSDPWYKATADCGITTSGTGAASQSCVVNGPNVPGANHTAYIGNTNAGGDTVSSTADASGNTQVKTTGPATAIAECVGAGLGSCILASVASAILGVANFLLGIAGVLFNLVMVYGVFQFANTIGNSPGVLTSWGILRDLANMALLFGFIFMGIATILDTGAVQNFTAKKALPQLLIFAILMNFSLFTAEAMIDVSNALSSTMYTQANTDPCTTGSTSGALTFDKCGINYGLAGHIMQSTGLAGIWAVKDSSLGVSVTTYFGLALFATIGAIVLFAGAIMLAIRVVSLTLLMVVSPIGFAGMAIPPLRKVAGDWWTRVIHQAFYAPIMLLMILISLKIADSFTQQGGNNTLGSNTLGAAVANQDPSIMGVFLVFMLVIGFMVASLIVANRFGAMGATAAVGFGKKVVLGSYGRVAGIAGRNTIGRAGNWAQKRYESGIGQKKALRSLLIATGADRGIVNATDKLKNAKFGGPHSFIEKQQHREKRTGELVHAAETAQLKRDLEDAIAKPNNDSEVARILQKMSSADIEQTKYVKDGAAGIEVLARNLSPDKFDEMMKNKEMGADKKENLSHGRYAELKQQIASSNDTEIRKWSAKDLELLAKYDPAAFDKLVQGRKTNGDNLFSNDQFEVLHKSNALTQTQKQFVKDESRNGRINTLLDTQGGGRVPTAADITNAQNLMRTIGGAKNMAKLSADVLTNSTVARSLTPAQLGAIMTEDKLTTTQQRALAAIVHARATAGEQAIIDFINPVTNQAAAAYYTP